jgi:hypothetical protein
MRQFMATLSGGKTLPAILGASVCMASVSKAIQTNQAAPDCTRDHFD